MTNKTSVTIPRQGGLKHGNSITKKFHSATCEWASGTPERGCITGALPSALWKRGQRWQRCPSHHSIISTTMIYQDQLETNLLKLFVHTKFKMVFHNFYY